MQRTTINLEKTLLEKIRAYGARKGWSLSKTIQELLKIVMFKKTEEHKKNFQWFTYRGKSAPGLDLDDRNNIYEMMGENREDD